MADIPNCPRGREEEYLSDIAGLTDNAPNNPWSRKEAYLAAIDGKMDNIEEQIAALATDISFKGSVPAQADLPETAAVGDAYITEDTGVIYVYVGESGTEPWVALGGSGINVVQTTGTSQTDVMSQNATTSMVFADPASKKRIAIGFTTTSRHDYDVVIGYGATTAGGASLTGQVSIGNGAYAAGRSAVAIGEGSIATTRGQFAINASNNSGYNSTNYRLLTGLYDPQNAHDAANKEYVDGTTESVTIATTDWTALASSDPYDYSATVTLTATIGANSTVELINDQAVLFGTYGFAIGSVSGQNVTIYSIGQPDTSVTLKLNVKG